MGAQEPPKLQMSCGSLCMYHTFPTPQKVGGLTTTKINPQQIYFDWTFGLLNQRSAIMWSHRQSQILNCERHPCIIVPVGFQSSPHVCSPWNSTHVVTFEIPRESMFEKHPLICSSILSCPMQTCG